MLVAPQFLLTTFSSIAMLPYSALLALVSQLPPAECSRLFSHAGYPVVALDYPKADGTSTFTDYADFFGDKAAYFDIGKESSNLMEIPNLKGLSPEMRKERFEDYLSFLESSLLMLVQSTDQSINQMATRHSWKSAQRVL